MARRVFTGVQLALLLSLACALTLSLCLAAPAPKPAPHPVALPRALPAPALSAEATSACRCTREFNAVCGNDGQTYSNKCLLECARAQGSSRMGQALRLAKYGAC